ncbi:MAG: NUDIX hydrolase [Algisphaera sp.]
MNPTPLYQGKFLTLAQRGRWEYATRTNATGVIAIVALHDDDRIVLIEQDRPAVGARVIELPAGLAGDTDASEPLLQAAKRELEEETGYTANHWATLPTVTCSAGLTDEEVTFFLATQLTQTSAGGGVDGEDITRHEIPLAILAQWLAKRQATGLKIAATLLAGVYAATAMKEELKG